MSGSGYPEWIDKGANTYLNKTSPDVAKNAVDATEYRDSWTPTERWPPVANKNAYVTKVAQNMDPGLPRGSSSSRSSGGNRGTSSGK